MKLGIPSLIEFDNVRDHLAFASEHGFSFFEINLSFPWFQSDKLDMDELRSLSKEYGVEYTIHLHDQLNPFDFAPEIREGGMKSIDYALTLAERVGAERLTLHLQYGMYSSVNGKKIYAYDVKSDEYLDYVDRMANMVSSRLRNTDTCFCIENTKGFLPYHRMAIERMLAYDSFGLTFDVGHNKKAACDDESFILSHRDRIRHFHIHDVTDRANHVALGKGILDLDRYLKMAADLDCPVVLEVKETKALVDSLEYLKERGL